MKTNTIFSRIAVAAAALGLLSAPAGAVSIKGIQPVANAGFERFETYSIRIDSFGAGPDGNYQAVLTLKNTSPKKASVTASSFGLVMLNSYNEPRPFFGNLYNADSMGPIAALAKLQDAVVLEPQEQTRVRVMWRDSAGFQPTKLRLVEKQWNEGTVVYSIAAGAPAGTSAATSGTPGKLTGEVKTSDGTIVGAVAGDGGAKGIVVWTNKDKLNRDVPAGGIEKVGNYVVIPMTAKQFYAIKGR